MTLAELTDILVLYHVKGLTRRQAGQLVEKTGRADAVFGLPHATLVSYGLKADVAAAILARRVTDDIRREAEFVEKNGIRAIGFWEEDYPPLLRECPDAPVMLFGRGNFDFSENPLTISVVGTRSVTPYGSAATAEIIRALAPFKPIIVSGLAYGVDVEAHRAALENGLPTVGVLGQGLGTPLYPAQNRPVAKQMCQTPGGGILTEYVYHTPATPGLFPARNRIVAGMSRATIVVEAKVKGGALITAELASGYNREVFAVPGRTIDPCSAGCNSLIRRNKAIMADDPATIVEELGLARKTPRPSARQKQEKDIRSSVPVQTGLFDGLSAEQKKIASALSGVTKMHVDELCTDLQMPVHVLSGLLLEMELGGLVETLPGKYYAIAAAARGQGNGIF